jgi:hypothetical protein
VPNTVELTTVTVAPLLARKPPPDAFTADPAAPAPAPPAELTAWFPEIVLAEIDNGIPDPIDASSIAPTATPPLPPVPELELPAPAVPPLEVLLLIGLAAIDGVCAAAEPPRASAAPPAPPPAPPVAPVPLAAPPAPPFAVSPLIVVLLTAIVSPATAGAKNTAP